MTLLEIWAGWNIISAIGTALSAVVAILYTCFTYSLLNKTKESVLNNNKLVQFQIYSEIAKNFSSENFRNLSISCRNNTLNIADSSQVINTLLNPLEDLAKYYQDNLISFDDLNTGYSSIILHVINNQVVREIINRERLISVSVYQGLEALYREIYSRLDENENINFINNPF